MKIILTNDYNQMSAVAAEIIASEIKNNAHCVLGLATGSTPIGAYHLLCQMNQAGIISFADVSTVNLDEYVGLPADHNQSYAYFMRKQLFDRVDINQANTHIPCGMAQNLEVECEQYSKLVSALGVDLQLLGLGSNGHIGFNEPGTPMDSFTHVVQLTQSTIVDNSRLFDDISQVPTRAISMGIADILHAKKILLIASGANKAQAVYDMVAGPVSSNCPASFLQLHPDCTIVIDKDANSILQFE